MKYRIKKQMKLSLNAKIYGMYINSSEGIIDTKNTESISSMLYSIIGNIVDKFDIVYDATSQVRMLHAQMGQF